jgi:hypothetical protein
MNEPEGKKTTIRRYLLIMSFISKPRCRFCMLKVNNLKHGHLKGLLSTEITDSGFDSHIG